MVRLHPMSTLFPYTSLFRSAARRADQGAGGVARVRSEGAQLRHARTARVDSSPWHVEVARLQIGHERRRLRSEEHTSELQSLRHMVCRLLLEKKKYT